MTTKKNAKRSRYEWETTPAWCSPEGSRLLGIEPPRRSDAVPPSENRFADDDERAKVAGRYDRMASLYDIHDAPMVWMGTRWRRPRLVSEAAGHVLKAVDLWPKGIWRAIVTPSRAATLTAKGASQ